MREQAESTRTSKQYKVLTTLRERIISGRYRLGDSLSERALAEDLGVSRLPVREALSKLEGEGLVDIAPRRGAQVRNVSSDYIKSLYQVREALEGMAARLASERMSDKRIGEFRNHFQNFSGMRKQAEPKAMSRLGDAFHAAIIAGSRNSIIIGIGNSISAQVRFVRRLSYVDMTFDLSITAAQQHLKIVEAMSERNPNLAERRIREHIFFWSEVVLGNVTGDVME